VQSVQLVPGGYLVTFGRFLLLAGHADLLGRRRMLIAGTDAQELCADAKAREFQSGLGPPA
jgi:hypothetical protein